MIRIFDDLQALLDYEQGLKILDHERDLRLYQEKSVLVYDGASERVLVSVQYRLGPLVEVFCASLECRTPEPGRFALVEPLASLADSPSVRWEAIPGSEQRVGILTVGDEKEVSPLYRSFRAVGVYKQEYDLSSHYAWIGRSVLAPLFKTRKRISRGLHFAASLLSR